jgi:hypothetical protein
VVTRLGVPGLYGEHRPTGDVTAPGSTRIARGRRFGPTPAREAGERASPGEQALPEYFPYTAERARQAPAREAVRTESRGPALVGRGSTCPLRFPPLGPCGASEEGYARTTARDIAAAAGTSMAAIGYHFRSKDALLMAAMLEAFDEWRAARTVGPVQVALLSGLIT